MGLENGIVVVPKTDKGRDFLITYYPSTTMAETINHENPWKEECEFVYWRKCFNIRNKFVQEFRNEYDEEKQEIKFSYTDIPRIMRILKYFLEEDNWEENGYSIWAWHERIIGIAEAIHYFYVLLEGIYSEKICSKDIEIYFYDSY